MSELGLEGITKNDIIKNISSINYNLFMLPIGTIENEITAISGASIKFDKLAKKLEDIESYADKKTKKKIFIYIPNHDKIASIKTLSNLLIPLEEEVRTAFYITSSLIYIEEMYNWIDNYNINEAERVPIKTSKSLRSIKLQLCKVFYEDLIQLFLNLVVDFYYNVKTMKETGYSIQECAMMAADLCYDLKHSYEQKFILENYGSNDVKNDGNKELKKIDKIAKTTVKKTRVKKNKNLTVE